MFLSWSIFRLKYIRLNIGANSDLTYMHSLNFWYNGVYIDIFFVKKTFTPANSTFALVIESCHQTLTFDGGITHRSYFHRPQINEC